MTQFVANRNEGLPGAADPTTGGRPWTIPAGHKDMFMIISILPALAADMRPVQAGVIQGCVR
jgi:hypothetical protein